jgi:hypothetical protein
MNIVQHATKHLCKKTNHPLLCIVSVFRTFVVSFYEEIIPFIKLSYPPHLNTQHMQARPQQLRFLRLAQNPKEEKREIRLLQPSIQHLLKTHSKKPHQNNSTNQTKPPP